jgi:hypothetical protein
MATICDTLSDEVTFELILSSFLCYQNSVRILVNDVSMRPLEKLEELNQSLRNRDKLKDDAIAKLSDQLMALSTRLQEIERRQQLI